MDAVGIEAADGHNLLYLGDADLAAGRGRLIEIAGGLAEHEVAAFVRLPALDNAEIGADAAFEDIVLAIEILDLLALGDLGADAGLGVEAGNSRAAGPHSLGKRPLRTEFDLQLTSQILPLELLILALSLIHISEPTRLLSILYAVF